MSLSAKIVNWAKARRGQRVGRGECWDLAENALNASGGKNSNDLGPVARNSNYVWGRAITLANLSPGNICQFRNYSTEIFDAQTHQKLGGYSFGHHTAIIGSSYNDGALELVQQNYANNRFVTIDPDVYLRPGTFGNYRVTASGNIWCYEAIIK